MSTIGAETENRHFEQYNLDSFEAMTRLTPPYAAKIYFLIVRKTGGYCAMAAGYRFFADYFGIPMSAVRRAMRTLEKAKVLQIIRSGAIAVYLLNPPAVKECSGAKYREAEGRIIL